jgi:hypothetical protein
MKTSITQEQVKAFLEDVSETCQKHGIGFAGFDNGLYIFDIKTDTCLCDDGDISINSDGSYYISKPNKINELA